MKQVSAVFILMGWLLSGCTYQKAISVSVGDADRTDAIVTIPLSDIPSAVSLTETTGGMSEPVKCQIVREDGQDALWFVLSGDAAAGSERTFTLEETGGRISVEVEAEAGSDRMSRGMIAVDDGKSVSLRNSGRNILTYNYAVTLAPEGVSHLYDRGGYIHPAYSPSGMVLTAIQPEDHYHHYGIWNPWTRVEYDGAVYDLWNLGDSLGTVRAGKVTAVYSGDVMAGFDAGLEHYVFAPEGEIRIMNEEWRVRAFETSDGFLWNFTSILEPLEPIAFKQYRYQGFTVRGTAEWKEEETIMMTSEGLERPDIDASRARWIYVNGRGKGVSSGVLFMSSTSTFNSPEPLRIWKTGDVFVNFSPPKAGDWILEPGQKYRLDYRVLTYDGQLTPDRAESLWQDFAEPAAVVVE